MLSFLIIIIIIAADQLTKRWAFNVLRHLETIPIIKNVLHLTYAENTGAAFSILKGHRWIFIAVSSFALLVIFYLLFIRRISHPLAVISLSMIAGGGIGNMIDRVSAGYVIDMVDFRLINFAIFNLADSFITIGAILFALVFLTNQNILNKRPNTSKSNAAFYGAFRFENSLSKTKNKTHNNHGEN